jgi:hypothetical protein
MLPWGEVLLTNIIRGGLGVCFNAHPELAIPERRWGSITCRIAPVILDEHRKRFGNPVDRLLARYVAEEVLKEIEPIYPDPAWGRRTVNVGGRT